MAALRRLVVEATGFGVRGALLEDDRLIEVLDVDAHGDQILDRLFLGRVSAVDRTLNAAFVDIGLAQPALLAAKDARFAKGLRERQPIGKLVREGEYLLVQGLREPVEDKGGRVTTDIRLMGFHLLWRPSEVGPETGPARGAEREALRIRGEQLFPGRAVSLRRHAARVGDDVLRAELARLEARWRQVRAEAEAKRRPGPLSGGEHPLEVLLRDALTPELAGVAVADLELVARARALLEGPLAPHGIALERLDPARSAFEQTGVAEQLEQALAREIAIPGGGRLIVEPTSALVAIDVDGGNRAALEVDLAAAREIARILRLRNLGGTIVVDFVDLPTRNERVRLEQALAKAFRDDPAPVQIHPMTATGLVEIGRSRRGRSLDQLLRRACPACAGSGRVPSLRARAEALFGVLMREGAARVRAAPDLARYLQTEAGAVWASFAERTRLLADPALAPGEFRTEPLHGG
ncbi:MAG: ribonuclease E/G [Geminicoccaceae bacterium]|nr:ribonuclease E/G [Geminicoccaceae bacterium]MDW8339863.1 ribonuclease E/G [Geminicoccaceae bacterium]